MLTPDNLTQAFYRNQGKHCIKVETWTLYPKPRRKDMLGFADYQIFDDDGFMALCQTTTKNNISARRKKILGKTSFSWWCKAGRRVFLHGWYRKTNKEGVKIGKWILHEEELTMDDWHQYQKELKEKNNTFDRTDPLYLELKKNHPNFDM